ncbi:MAG: hypothetical protein ACP5I8_09460 [Phycisphaerae bacterium]
MLTTKTQNLLILRRIIALQTSGFCWNIRYITGKSKSALRTFGVASSFRVL